MKIAKIGLFGYLWGLIINGICAGLFITGTFPGGLWVMFFLNFPASFLIVGGGRSFLGMVGYKIVATDVVDVVSFLLLGPFWWLFLVFVFLGGVRVLQRTRDSNRPSVAKREPPRV